MRFSRAVLALPALALVASGCSAFSDESATDDGELTVAAAFYPLQFVAERVAGEHADVVQLTQPGTEPHDLELSISETAEISEADLVVYEEGFQPAVDDAVEQNAEGVALDAASVVDLMAVEETAEEHEEHGEEEHTEDEHAEDEHAEDEHTEDEHAEDEHAEEDGHDHGDVDPHFWQDPLRVADLADAVAAELADLDSEHADDYEANAAALRADLEDLDAAFTTGLADCERDTIVVSHDAFGYLEKYDLHIAPIVGLSPDAEPTAAVLGELEDLIRTEGITTVFSEPLEPALGEGLAADLDLTEAVLDPVEGLTDATAEEDYLSLMESNLEAIRTANACQ
ncbi:zinc transport system substrate-binding protein [Nocardioides thalensis]|uniref:Zinc transport system substrate-binding protein n=1 Tax=Nocardioides thalensis TaxID=1914755 RepID=A0A853C0Y7_9ACTN|nr:metal ABC transporter substrate-binding protein [Nocardioides thalensis]NYJ00924.1 zinc transport system substrate-binding protein [Nocardioides thalensis]